MKNLSILEGNRGRFQNGVKRVIADLQGGGTSIWVPAEERLLKTKYITENGTYLASAEELWGFSKLTVNVAGGAEGTQVPTIDKDGNPTDYQVPTYGPVTVDPTIDPSDYPTLPPISGGIGSSIVGIDPITGNMSIATVDPHGNINMSTIPDGIRIKTPPHKTSYVYGENIDYDGLVIELLKTDGSTFTDDTYKNGTIAWGLGPFPEPDAEHPHRNFEVVTSVVKAGDGRFPTFTTPADDSSMLYKFAGITFTFALIPVGTVLFGNAKSEIGGVEVWRTYALTQADSQVFACLTYKTVQSGNYYDTVCYASNGKFTLSYIGPTGIGDEIDEDEYTIYVDHTGIASFEHQAIVGKNNGLLPRTEYETSAVSTFWFEDDMVKFGYGEEGEQSIPVMWESPYDGRTLQDSFNISVDTSTGGGGAF